MREVLRRDVTYAANSLLALVLLLAGAHARWSAAALAVAAGYMVVRLCGKLTAGSLAARVFRAAPRPPARLLISPGVFGVAFALDLFHTLGAAFEPVLTVVVAGTIASSLMAALAHREMNA